MSVRTRLITYSNPSKSGSNKPARRAGNMVRRGKRPAPRDKNAGSVFEQRNALARLRVHLRDEVRNRAGRACHGWRFLRLSDLTVFPVQRHNPQSESAQTLSKVWPGQSTAALFNRCRQLTQHFVGIFPADTGVGDTFSIEQRLAALQALVAFHQMTLNHHTDNRLLTVDQLL